jgi:acylglycerol lipase
MFLKRLKRSFLVIVAIHQLSLVTKTVYSFTMKLIPHFPIKYGFDPQKSPPEVPQEYAAIQDGGAFLPSPDQRLWLFHRKWEPPEDVTVIATLMILHGTVDHSGVYSELGKALSAQGIAVIALDQRGWGLSDGESMYMYDVDTYVEDLVHVYQHIHRPEGRYHSVSARFLLGKSIGGTVSAYAVAQYPNYWTGLVGLSGGYELDQGAGIIPSPEKLLELKSLAGSTPKLPLKPLFDPELLVSDKTALKRFQDDPLCCKDWLRVGFVLESISSIQKLSDEVMATIDIPMLIMYGDDDHLVTRSGHERMVEKNLHVDKSLKIYPGGRHNMLQEPKLKDQVIEDIRQWVLERKI